MLVEDQADFRHLIATLLGRQQDLEVVAQAGSLAEARRHAAVVEFDVAVLDLGLPDGNGADLIAELRRASPGVGVLILSASLDANNLKKATMQSVMRSGHRHAAVATAVLDFCREPWQAPSHLQGK